MIATLSGIVSEKVGDLVVVDVRGVGYGVLVAHDEFSKTASGEAVKFYIYEHIKEDAHDLYGFMQLDAMRLFEQLLSVNGVGPKMALSVMNVGSGGDVRAAIARGDTKWLSQASGVGKRVAERIVVDLKDKVGLASSDDAVSFLSGPSAAQVLGDEAVQALVALGFTSQDAVSALSDVDKALPTEERVKQALKGAAL